MSLKNDYRDAMLENAALRKHIIKLTSCYEKSQLLTLMLMNDVAKAKSIADFKGIQKAVIPLMEEKAKYFDICLPLSDDEELKIV